jgi:aspartate/methionine/tyrosine aminotransferase
MGFAKNDYLSWYVPRIMRGDGAVNLHASGVPLVPADEIDWPAWPAGEEMRRGPAVEQAIAEWLALPAAEVVFTPGATGGTLLALLELAGPGAGIVVENPIYEPMLRQAERFGEVRRLERRLADGWRLSLDEARSLIDDRTAVVMITEPHNPSGIFAPRDDVLELARIARGHDAVLLVNEVYQGYTDAPSYHGTAENLVVVSSISKLFGAYWARVGWLSAAPAIAGRLRAAHWNMGLPCQPGAQAGLGFLAQGAQRRQLARELGRSMVDEVDSWVQQTGLAWHRPQGPGFGCVALPAGTDDLALAERLHDELGVLVVPGRWFGVAGTLRLSWLQVGDRLAEGLERLQSLIV